MEVDGEQRHALARGRLEHQRAHVERPRVVFPVGGARAEAEERAPAGERHALDERQPHLRRASARLAGGERGARRDAKQRTCERLEAGHRAQRSRPRRT